MKDDAYNALLSCCLTFSKQQSNKQRQWHPHCRLCVLLLASSWHSTSAKLSSFEDVRDTVAHHLHQPLIEPLSELGEYVADEDLEVRIQFEVDNRTAVVEATVNRDLVPDGYRETYFYKDGSRQYRGLAPNQKR